MTIEFDGEGSDFVRCPHEGCGAKLGDLWELYLGGEEDIEGVECGTCGKTFTITRTFSVDYEASVPE